MLRPPPGEGNTASPALIYSGRVTQWDLLSATLTQMRQFVDVHLVFIDHFSTRSTASHASFHVTEYVADVEGKGNLRGDGC